MKLRYLSIPLFLILFLLLTSIGANAQETPKGDTGLGKSPQSEEFDREALQKLRRLPPDQVEGLDAKLAEALTLFYDREYTRALPIFREISGTIETMDVMFWMASAAAGAGESEAAIENFKRMLQVDPDLHRVRLELATVYFSLGRYEDARAELQRVLQARPPESVRNNIQRMLAAIDERTRRLFTGFRGSVGVQWDSNVSAGPNADFIVIPQGGGTIGPLTETQKKLGDWAGVGTFLGTGTYDFGEKGSWMWNSTGSYYQTLNFRYHQFDYTQFRLVTGPWWVGARSVLKLPVGYAYNQYEHEHLFDAFDFTPSYEYFITPNISLQGTFSYARETYAYSAIPADDKSGQDGIIRIAELNPNFFFNSKRDILSFYFSDEDANTDNRVYTYDAVNLGISYFKLFEIFHGEMEFFGRYRYTKRDYAEPALLWPAGYLRKDERHNFYFVLSRNISKHLFASVSYNYIKNDSNTDLYDFDKDVWAFTLGFRF